jgi:hypothetical protein
MSICEWLNRPTQTELITSGNDDDTGRIDLSNTSLCTVDLSFVFLFLYKLGVAVLSLPTVKCKTVEFPGWEIGKYRSTYGYERHITVQTNAHFQRYSKNSLCVRQMQAQAKWIATFMLACFLTVRYLPCIISCSWNHVQFVSADQLHGHSWNFTNITQFQAASPLHGLTLCHQRY